ncbi:hypothetical protein V494_01499 [Pseudogymnoascus sp. VKM F-4513 (FW-928)]|nr:hypothetical protein V494_01499 [Pseudogymnoascus sp. VKM F-4513 (FW-928)]
MEDAVYDSPIPNPLYCPPTAQAQNYNDSNYDNYDENYDDNYDENYDDNNYDDNNYEDDNALNPPSDHLAPAPAPDANRSLFADKFILIACGLCELFRAIYPAIWNWILAYSTFTLARMVWSYTEDDWLNFIFAIMRMVDVMSNFCAVRE